MKSNPLRPSGASSRSAGGREERLHEKCGDWRTFLSYPGFLSKRKQNRCCYASYSLLPTPETQAISTITFALGSIVKGAIPTIADPGA
jgi:hypothetical protein